MHEYAGGRKMKEKILNLLIFDRTQKERKMLLKLFWLVFSIIAIFVVIFHLKGSFAFLIFYGLEAGVTFIGAAYMEIESAGRQRASYLTLPEMIFHNEFSVFCAIESIVVISSYFILKSLMRSDAIAEKYIYIIVDSHTIEINFVGLIFLLYCIIGLIATIPLRLKISHHFEKMWK